MILSFIIIFVDGECERLPINVGPSNSKKFLGKWGQMFIEGIEEALPEIPIINECELEYCFIDDFDPANDKVFTAGHNPKEIALKYLAVMVPLLRRMIAVQE